MLIAKLQAENFKALKAVEIEVNGAGNIIISGPNGAGKTSVLDIIGAAVAGPKFCKMLIKPIRAGENKGFALVETDTGLTIKRTWSKNGAPGKLIIKDNENRNYSSPQAFLDKLIGDLSFDPLEFAGAKPKEQKATLLGLVDLEIDLDEMAEERAALFSERTDVNRDEKRKAAQIEGIGAIDPGTPESEVSSKELLEEYQSATNIQNEQSQRKERIGNALEKIEDIEAESKGLGLHVDDKRAHVETGERFIKKTREELDAHVPQDLEKLQKKIDEATREYRRAVDLENERARKTEHLNDAMEKVEGEKSEIAGLEKQAKDKKAQLEKGEAFIKTTRAEIEAFPEVDLEEIQARIDAAEETNLKVRQKQEKAGYRKEHLSLLKESEALTTKISDIDFRKETALSMAKFPIKGLGFDDEGVTFNGIPFAQCCLSEKLKVGIAISMALNPEFRVIRVTDASLLDAKNMAVIEEMANKEGFQVWLEVVDSTKEIGICIEDGEVEGAAK